MIIARNWFQNPVHNLSERSVPVSSLLSCHFSKSFHNWALESAGSIKKRERCSNVDFFFFFVSQKNNLIIKEHNGILHNFLALWLDKSVLLSCYEAIWRVTRTSFEQKLNTKRKCKTKTFKLFSLLFLLAQTFCWCSSYT